MRLTPHADTGRGLAPPFAAIYERNVMPRALPRMFGERAEIQKPHVRICAGGAR
jgi:hypothetical protein